MTASWSFAKPPGSLRVAYFIGQAATLDNMVLYPDQQFDVLSHSYFGGCSSLESHFSATSPARNANTAPSRLIISVGSCVSAP